MSNAALSWKPRALNIPVLTYHSTNVNDASYSGNDHVALQEDLRLLTELEARVISLDELIAWHSGAELESRPGPCVALTFDDGSDFDYHDLPHPSLGMQRSFYNLLEDHRKATGLDLHASCFVITSPAAREQLDQRALIGKGWWRDDWWPLAQSSGLLSIECHSWDHVHPVVDRVSQAANRKGDFRAVATQEDCDHQVRQAGDFIQAKLHGRRPRYFAYPWGEFSEFLATEYFPEQQSQHQFQAAFTVEPQAVGRDHSRWTLPRFVCGRDWKSSRELRDLLEKHRRAA
jgi:peptidoglycan/xylan/chitin deacetylase (PgdA/CDA1 family)